MILYEIKKTGHILTTQYEKDEPDCYHFNCNGVKCEECPWFSGRQSVRQLIKRGIIECLEE